MPTRFIDQTCYLGTTTAEPIHEDATNISERARGRRHFDCSAVPSAEPSTVFTQPVRGDESVSTDELRTNEHFHGNECDGRIQQSAASLHKPFQRNHEQPSRTDEYHSARREHGSTRGRFSERTSNTARHSADG